MERNTADEMQNGYTMLPLVGGTSPFYALKSVVRPIALASLIGACLFPGPVLRAQLGAAGLAPLKIPTSVTLAGTVNQGVSDALETGTVTLTVNADGSTSEAWNLSSGKRSYVTYPYQDGRNCQYTGDKGKTTEIATADCFHPFPWFAPWLAAKTLTDKLTTALEGTTDADKAKGTQAQLFTHALSYSSDPKSHGARAAKALMAQTSMLLTSDTATLLPQRVDFKDAIPSDPAKQIETYVLFSDYRLEGVYLIPHRIRRYIQRSLQADIQINSITIQ